MLKWMGIGTAGAVLAGCRTSSPRGRKRGGVQPNILFISTDYQAWEDMPCESPWLDMPALDRLCREGAVLARHYSNAPICMPARYTWISGRYPHSHGEFDNDPKWLPEGMPTMMEYLKKEGYHTVGVGKMHFHPWDRTAGFDRRIVACCKEAGWKRDDYAEYLRANGFDCNRIYKEPDADEFPRIYDFPQDEKFHIDHYVGEQATQLVEQDELQGPWFMWVSFNGPHSPWDAPAAYSKPYKKMSLPACRTYPWELNEKPANHTWERYVYTRGNMDYIDHYPEKRAPMFQAMRAAHCGNLTFIDRQVERLLAVLEARRQLDNTIVIWSADHGACLGDHDMIHKATHYERSAHVPFVVRYPVTVPPRRVEGFSGHVDLLPTILSLVGAPIPAELEGKDLSPMLRGKADKVQDEVFIEIRNDVSIVTDNWKMSVDTGPWFPTAYPIRKGDLYDRKADPNELRNLYDDPRHTDIQRELTGRIVAFNPGLKDKIAYPTRGAPSKPTKYLLVAGDVLDRHS